MGTVEENIIKDYRLEGKMLKIRTYPDPVLKKVAAPVETFDSELKKLCHDMLFTMYYSRGIGLAAPQVGISKRIFVVDVDYDRNNKRVEDGKTIYSFAGFRPLILINPVISEREGKIVFREGCLSLPKVYDDVTRYYSCRVDYQDVHGKGCSMKVEDLYSICLQHENDHLDGIVFLERLSPMKRELYTKKLLKRHRRTLAEQSA